MTDDALAARLDGLVDAIDSFSSVMRSVEAGEGAVGALLAADGAGEQAIRDIQEAAAALKRVAQRLEAPEGLVGRLLNDPEYSDQLADDLATTLRNVAEITQKINDGQGTLGALVNERVLYDGAEEVVAGVNDSKFARWLTRHYRKKGIKAEEGEVIDDPSPPEGP
jgi:phospholipid/cholesterol/gamma-HCH transport system substrate-binding protein